MVDLLNIGRGGILAYRSALSVTGENIANVDTEGYRRRDIVLQQASGGNGVNVAEVRRAFDNLVAERNRAAQSGFAASETFLTQVKALEDRLLPGDGGIPDLLDGFFDALDGLSAAPSDSGLRQVVLNAGSALADGIASMAISLEGLDKNVADEFAQSVNETNDLLEGMARIQDRLQVTSDENARNSLLDQRDKMLADLAGQLDIHVTLDERQIANVRLGADEAGPELLAFGRAARLVPTEDSRLTIYQADPNDPVVTRSASKGALAGLTSARGAIGQAIYDLDAWASGMASELNEIHSQGLTMTGEPGTDLFTVSGWVSEAGALMRGSSVARPTVTDASVMPEGPLTLVFDGPSGLWQAQDGTGTVLSEGTDLLTVPGLKIEMLGRPVDGDRLTLTRRDDAARNMALVLDNPAKIAAAGALRISASASNTGVASVSARNVTPQSTGLTDLAGILGDDAVEFLSPGVIGVIPAGSGSATLSAQARNAMAEITVPLGADPVALTFTTTNGPETFSFPAGTTLAGAAALLNSGEALSANDLSLTDLGLVAEAEDGMLAVSARTGFALPAMSLTSSAGVHTGVVVADAAPAGDLSVFTRDGRQLSGPPLSAEAAAQLITPANGFNADATYRVDYLNAAAGFGPTTQERIVAAGDFTLQLGLQGGIASWTDNTPAAAFPATAIGFDGAGASLDVALPEGANATWRADALSAALPVSATAETRVALDLPASGALSFRIAGDNIAGIQINANLSAGGPAALEAAINAQTGGSGIRAELSPEGNRLTLIHEGGADITLTQLAHSANAPVTLTRLDANNASLGTVTLGAGGPDAARIAGTVQVTGALPYGITEDGVLSTAARNPFANGLLDVTSADAGATLLITPADPVPGDIAMRSFDITGADGRIHTAQADPALGDGPALAAGLLADLRSTAPASLITGDPLTALPPDGAQMRVSLGDQTYGIRMTNGVPVVSGPEAGRVTAAFDAQNRLVISTEGGDLNGGALTLPTDAGEAARFGMGLTSAAMTTVVGQPFDAGNLPASFMVKLGGNAYTISVSAGNVILPPTFPGTGWINTAYGRVEIHFGARAGELEIPAQATAANAGFDTLGLSGTVEDGALRLTATDERVLEISANPADDGTTLRFDNLPDEELLVVLSGNGALRLSGDVTQSTAPNPAREMRVLDAATGLVGLFDQATGAHLASRTLDEAGTVQFGSLFVTLSSGYATGDTFTFAPNTSGMGDARAVEAMANLRLRDPNTGQGGYSSRFADIQARAGAQTRAAEDRTVSATSERDAAERAEAEFGAVDLDAEAAQLLQQQQAYQANAQVITVARQLFDTLLQSI